MLDPRDTEPRPPVVAVTGATGMLGTDVVAELRHRGIDVRPLTRAECDLTSADSVSKVLFKIRPVAVINCASYTDVNRAESEVDVAMQVNANGPRRIAAVCREINARLIHVSTDYVFDGISNKPYKINDITNPINAYGHSKLAGEQAVSETMLPCTWTIARTSWLYGANGPNFVSKMLELGRAGKDLKIINDQVGAPTYTVDLARALVDLLDVKPAGVIHVTAQGHCSWFDFAKEIFRRSRIRPKTLVPCSSSEFHSPAQRPANSQLSSDSLLQAGVSLLPDWKEGLERYLLDIGVKPR